jgi:hypothetical protein
MDADTKPVNSFRRYSYSRKSLGDHRVKNATSYPPTSAENRNHALGSIRF